MFFPLDLGPPISDLEQFAAWPQNFFHLFQIHAPFYLPEKRSNFRFLLRAYPLLEEQAPKGGSTQTYKQ